jgi:hypothetical protein
VNRTCNIDSVPRLFDLMPARFSSRLDHLRGINWNKKLFERIILRHDRS